MPSFVIVMLQYYKFIPPGQLVRIKTKTRRVIIMNCTNRTPWYHQGGV